MFQRKCYGCVVQLERMDGGSGLLGLLDVTIGKVFWFIYFMFLGIWIICYEWNWIKLYKVFPRKFYGCVLQVDRMDGGRGYSGWMGVAIGKVFWLIYLMFLGIWISLYEKLNETLLSRIQELQEVLGIWILSQSSHFK